MINTLIVDLFTINISIQKYFDFRIPFGKNWIHIKGSTHLGQVV